MGVARTSERPAAPLRNRDDAVLSTAIAVMAARGYAATSVQEVADRVGVLKGSLHHYFSSKEELLFRILESSHLETTSSAQDVAPLGLSPVCGTWKPRAGRDLLHRPPAPGGRTTRRPQRVGTRLRSARRAFVIGTVDDVRFWPSRSGRTFTAEEMADALVVLTRSAPPLISRHSAVNPPSTV